MGSRLGTKIEFPSASVEYNCHFSLSFFKFNFYFICEYK